MTISSPTFKELEMIPVKYTCRGQNINPPLQISGVPESAKSLTLIVDDPDAPMGTFTHWLQWNIDPRTTVIAENSQPGTGTKFIGPCPPTGTHRYFFKLYALDTKLDSLNESTMAGHVLEKAELMGKYGQ